MDFQTSTVQLSEEKGIGKGRISRAVRRVVDVLFAIPLIILSIPVLLLFAVLIRSSSRGPLFYLQERIGYLGKPFKIIKFRSMYTDAEKDGPGLSFDTDPRATPLGRFMRRKKIDELPQLFNVLKGDMSFIGPRPERKYYIDQIVAKRPEYRLLHQVKPGITSAGQVWYGYAKNVDEMLERMELDLHYVRNRSFWYDLKVLWYTFAFLLRGKIKG